MAVLYQRPARGLSTLTAKLRTIYGNPARTYEYVTGYGTGGRSSHNADANGIAHAVDIFVGPGNLSEAEGIDLAERLRAEGKRGVIPGHPDRLAYIIHRGQIAGDHTNWEWIPYTGKDWHGDHIHVSSVFDYLWGETVAGHPLDYDSTADWDLWETEFQPANPQSSNITPIQEDDMPLSTEDLHAIRTSMYDILQDKNVLEKQRTSILNLTSLKNIQGTFLPLLTAQAGQIAGLQKALSLLAQGQGVPIDLATVEAAAKKGAAAALEEGIKVDITVAGAK